MILEKCVSVYSITGSLTENNIGTVFISDATKVLAGHTLPLKLTTTLDRKVLDNSAVVIIDGEKSALSSLEKEKELLRENKTVPVIYAARGTIALEDASVICSQYNFFAADRFVDHSTLMAALHAHETIKQFRKNAPNAELALQQTNPPRFRSALRLAERYEQQQRTFNELTKEAMVHTMNTIWKSLLRQLRKFKSDEKNPDRYRSIAQTAYKLFKDRNLLKALNMLGDLGSGKNAEADVHRIIPAPRRLEEYFPMFITRENAGSHARQRYFDAEYMRERCPSFKIPEILPPIAFEDFPHYGITEAWIIMAYVPSAATLSEFLATLSRAQASGELSTTESAKVRLLAEAFIKKAVDDTTLWIANSPPFKYVMPPRDPFAVKAFYAEKVAKVPEKFNAYTAFDFDEKLQKMWEKATSRVMEHIRIHREDLVVRARDAGCENMLISLQQSTSLSEVLDYFFDRHDTPMCSKVDECFWNIDPKRKYVHPLDDLARLIAEPAVYTFLFSGNELEESLHGTSPFTPEPLIDLRRRYLGNLSHMVDVPALEADNKTFFLLLLFHALRGLTSFISHWSETCAKYNAGGISSTSYELRKAEYTDNLMQFTREALIFSARSAAYFNVYVPFQEQKALGTAHRIFTKEKVDLDKLITYYDRVTERKKFSSAFISAVDFYVIDYVLNRIIRKEYQSGVLGEGSLLKDVVA